MAKNTKIADIAAITEIARDRRMQRPICAVTAEAALDASSAFSREPGENQRCTSTGIFECVSTWTVTLPSTMAATPRRPWEAMVIRSHPFDRAVSMMAW